MADQQLGHYKARSKDNRTIVFVGFERPELSISAELQYVSCQVINSACKVIQVN